MHGPGAASTSHAPTWACQTASAMAGDEARRGASIRGMRQYRSARTSQTEFAVTTRSSPAISRGMVFMCRTVTVECDTRTTREAVTMGPVSDESHWIRPRRRPPRPTGRSTVNGRTAKELLAEQAEAIRSMSLQELEAFVAKAAAGSRASRAEDEEAAAWRRAQRYRMN